ELAGFNRTEIRSEAKLICREDCRAANGFHRCHRFHTRGLTFAGHGPQFPVDSKPLLLSVRAKGNVTTGAQDFCGAASDGGEVIFLRQEPRTSAAKRIQQEMRFKAIELCIAMWIHQLAEVKFAPRPAVRHKQSRCIERFRSDNQLDNVFM